MNVLVIQLKRIGDLLLTTPALHALKRRGARTTLALPDNTAALLPGMTGLVDEALVFPKRAGVSETLALWGKVRRGRFDACVDLTGNDRSAFLTRLSGAPRRLVARDALRRAPRWRTWAYNTFADTNVRERHTVDRGLDHVATLGFGLPTPGGAEFPSPVLDLPAEARRRAREALAEVGGLASGEPFAVIHPGSARAEKYWQPERWAAVIDALQGERGLPCALTGGRGDPFEDAHLAAVRGALRHGPVRADLAGRLDLLTLAAVIAESTVFGGVDSGPMHLAAAARVPCVVLFGPTNPFHWRPRHPGAVILQASLGGEPAIGFGPVSPAAPMEAIPAAAVVTALEELLKDGAADGTRIKRG